MLPSYKNFLINQSMLCTTKAKAPHTKIAFRAGFAIVDGRSTRASLYLKLSIESSPDRVLIVVFAAKTNKQRDTLLIASSPVASSLVASFLGKSSPDQVPFRNKEEAERHIFHCSWHRRSSLVASLFIACSSLVAQTMISSGQKKIPSLEAEDDIDMENMELLFKDSSDFTCIAPVVGSSRSVAAAGPSSAAAAANPGIFTVTHPSSIPTAAGPSNTAAAAGPSSTTAAAGSSSTAATAGPSSTAAAAGLVDLARRGRGTKAGKHRKAKTFFQFLFHMSDTYSNHYYGGERGRGRGDGRGRGRGRGDGGRGRGRGRIQGD
ncbi:uncharacterized protein LOC143896438 [Temnothorax americanus]|uniref:uncharacterized protein LOC143896438 n=1 Tax=Temnothorax americanus TaxID=1964332 RepID=UPI0040695DAE